MSADETRLAARPATDDPILSYDAVRVDLNVSPTTFFRKHLPKLATVELGERRRGIRQSVYLDYKASLDRPAAIPPALYRPRLSR
jgi:hypothetical protein